MIRVFGTTDRSFLSNGDVVIQPLKARVHKQDNGDYYLDLQTGLEYSDYLGDGVLVVADTPQGEQAFRVSNVTKTKSKITIKAYHVFYDTKNYLIADKYVVDKTCAEALTYLNGATEPASPFTTASDVSNINTFRCVRKSLYEAIMTVLERWGGHLVRDNFTIQILSEIGQDNGVTVQYRKNLKDITCEENWSGVVTKLMPVGKDGILLNAVDQSASLYVVSETQYTIPFTKTVSFKQDILRESYETETAYKQALVADLRSQGQAYVNANCVPQVNYTLKANLDKITDIGDTVEVKDSRLGIDLTTHVIAFEYDCILGRYVEIEFGNFKESLNNLVSGITSSIDAEVDGQIQQFEDEIMGTLGGSYVIFDGDKILVVDTLPKQNAINCVRIDKDGLWFSHTGINGTFYPAWSINGTLDLQNIDLANANTKLVTGVKGEEEASYSKGDVNVTREKIGVDRVGNFDIEYIIST